MKTIVSFLLGLVLCVHAGTASAATVGGTLTANETWSGNIRLTADVIVPAGITLTVAPGTSVEVASEAISFVVLGDLDARGSEAAPITFKLGFGLQLRNQARATLVHTIFTSSRNALIATRDTQLTMSDSVVTQTSEAGLILLGTAQVSTTRFISNKENVIQVRDGRANLHHNEILLNCTAQSAGPLLLLSAGVVTFDHNSVVNNVCPAALRIGADTTVTNNIIFANRELGVIGAGVIDHNLVSGHVLRDVAPAITSLHAVSGDPRFVSATNLKLRFDSPAIGADSSGSDLGAHVFQTGPLHHLTVVPATATVPAGGQFVFKAIGEDESGNPVDTSGQSVTWQASVGSISGNVFTAGTLTGRFVDAVSARMGNLTATATVVVTPGPAAQVVVSPGSISVAPAGSSSFTAIVKDAFGNLRPDTVIWSVSPASVGVIDGGGRFFAGTTLGDFPAAVTATSGNASGSASVRIVAGGLARLDLTPTQARLLPGQQITFVVEGHDALGNLVQLTPVWTASSGGTINQAGTFTAGAQAGTFVDAVTATAGLLAVSATIVIEPGPAAEVRVLPTSITIAPGGTSTFTASVLDAQGNLRSDAVTWSVSDASAGTIDSTGRFRAGTSPGNHRDAVEARAAQVVGRASVTISAGALHHLILRPTQVTLAPGDVFGFSVQGRDADDHVIEVQPTWSVVHGGGRIGADGSFVAGPLAGEFADTVQVEAGGLSAHASVEILPGALAALALDAGSITLAVGATWKLSVAGRDADGNPVELTDVSWSVDPAAGTITQDGTFTAGSQAGEWPEGIVAKSGGLTAHALVRVTVTQVVTPEPPSDDDGGCGCAVGGHGPRGSAGLLLALAALVLLYRRSRVAHGGARRA